MTDFSVAALLELAKRHLGLPKSSPDSRVPAFYLEELRDHLKLYPLQDKFRVTLQPKKGFGIVKCLENGCNEVIPLIGRVKCPDGGKQDGLGSLSAYRTHLSSHLLRETRVRTRSDKASRLLDARSVTTKTEDTPPSARSRRALTRRATLDLSSLKVEDITQDIPAPVKREPVQAIIPRKRKSDIAFTEVKAEIDNDVVVATAPKKVKIEVDPAAPPLIEVTNSISAPAIPRTKMNPGQTYAQNLSTSLQKLPATAAPVPRTVPYTSHPSEIPVHNSSEVSYMNSSASTQRPTYGQASAVPAVKVEYTQPHPFGNPIIKRQPSGRVLQPFPMDLEPVDRKPSPSNAHYAAPLRQGTQQPQYPPAASPSSSFALSALPVMGNKPYVTGTRYDVFAIAPTAVDKKPNVTHTPYDIKPIATGVNLFARDIEPHTQANAVASSSNAVVYKTDQSPKISAGRFPGAYVDVSDNVIGFQDFPVGVDPLSRIDMYADRIGIRIPPPISDAHDENGDYYGRDRDLFVGPQAAIDDIDKFLIEAGNADNFDGNETVDKALAYLGLNTLHSNLPGMEVSLMAHQAMGVAWMLEKEKSTIQGGCLADEMGLGKTIQMVACMVMNRSTNPSCKTNLVIAPLALLDQWKLEIEEKTNCGLTCLIYHGQSRTRKKSILQSYDVVLTTFNTMAMEWPDYENEIKKKAKAKKRKEDWIVYDSDDNDMKDAHHRTEKRKQHAGILFQTNFFRIIADEGQQIRNRRTRMSRAITDLQARYRWVLTGTPIVNSLADVYGYVRFLKIRPWYDWAKFHGDIGKLEKKRPSVAVARLQKVMTTFLLRRKKDSMLDGKKLIELPDKEVVLRRLEFSPEEREIYAMIEARSQAKFNRYLRAGTVLKNYHQVLVLLLRLRQICSHPSLIQEDGVAFVHPDEAHVKPEFATELTRVQRLVSPEFVEKMKEKFKQQALNRIEAEKHSENATVEEEECPICFDAMTDAVLTPCAHIFCRECIVDACNQAPPMDPDHTPQAGHNDRSCPVCRSAISVDRLFSRQLFESTDKELRGEWEASDAMDIDDDAMDVDGVPVKGKGKAKKKKPKKRNVYESGSDDDYASEDDDDMSNFIVEDDDEEEEKDARRALKKRVPRRKAHIVLDSDDEPEEKEVIFGLLPKIPEATSAVVPIMSRFLPSSKMKFMMDQLQKLARSKPEEKTMVVSQWTGCLTLVSDYLTENGIPHVKYQGDMNRVKRDQAVKVFMSKEKARVMLMSLKCGGVGLNLTRANNVISLDLGWSQAVEAQAYDRVHRLGQTRNVTVQRIVIADTVEDRILALQERKQTLADGSLGEGTGKKIGKLSVKELANLFGLDGRGRRLAIE